MEREQTAIYCLALVFINFLAAGGNSNINAFFTVNGTGNDAGKWSANIGEFQTEVKHLSTPSRLNGLSWIFQVEHKTASSSSSVLNSHIQNLVNLARQPVSLNPNPEVDYVQLTSTSYYKYHHSLLSWSEALATCESEGAYLAIINSEHESDMVSLLFDRALLPPGSAAYYVVMYIGFHNLYDVNSFVTIFNESLSAAGYETWYQGYPKHNVEARCGARYDIGPLVSVSCSMPLPFVCEKDIGENQVTALGKAHMPVNELKRRLETGGHLTNKTSS